MLLPKMQVLYALEQQMREEGMSWEERTSQAGKDRAGPGGNRQMAGQRDIGNSSYQPVGKSDSLCQSPMGGIQCIRYARADRNRQQSDRERHQAPGHHKKNFLFCGSHQAAEMTAGMLSLMSTCKRNGVNVFE